MTEHLHVFVYGTLKPGEANFHYCKGRVEWQAAIAQGNLYDLPLGYPAMTAGTGRVIGYLLTFSDRTLLQALDELEDYDPRRPAAQNEYVREWIKVFTLDENFLGHAWCYRMAEDQALRFGGVQVIDGWWTGKSRLVPQADCR